MKSFLIFLFFVAFLAGAIGLGTRVDDSAQTPVSKKQPAVPEIGRVQILNGCGITGAAGAAADYLRQHSFDVKNIGNADTWNYPYTIIASRTSDTETARKVAEALGSDKLIILRDGKSLYDVTVFLGADFAERIQ